MARTDGTNFSSENARAASAPTNDPSKDDDDGARIGVDSLPDVAHQTEGPADLRGLLHDHHPRLGGIQGVEDTPKVRHIIRIVCCARQCSSIVVPMGIEDGCGC